METQATWREELICEFFLPMDAAAILSIPVCTRRQNDFWAWHYDHSGVFTVKSAYRMLMVTKMHRENYLEGNPGSSNAEAEEKGWSSLWKTSVPSKVRVFLWRLARQSLPTADLLQHRNMSQSSSCSIYGAVDSWRHSLIECIMSASVWALADDLMVEHMMRNNDPSAKQWLFDMLESLPHDQFTRLTVTLWAIWTARRKAIHEEIFQSPLSTHTFINSYLLELRSLEKPVSNAASRLPNPPEKNHWIPPPHEVAKINVDGAVAKMANRGAASAICRDHMGVYLGSSVMIFDGITDPAVLETLACREALALAEDLMLSSLYVASDCKQVVKDIHGGSHGRYGAIISEINHRSTIFQECSFVFESRASNFEAHNLAKHSLALGVGRHLWLGTPHSVTIPVILAFDE
jgi:hypothetical protein